MTLKLLFRSFILFLMLATASCYDENNYSPSIEKYTADTELIRKVSEKFLNEHSAEALHRTATALQLSRAVSCENYNGECEAFSDFLSEAIKLSENNKFEAGSQMKLRKKYDELVVIIEEGKKKIQAQ